MGKNHIREGEKKKNWTFNKIGRTMPVVKNF